VLLQVSFFRNSLSRRCRIGRSLSKHGNRALENFLRALACQTLGLDAGRLNICLQLGSEIAQNTIDLVAGITEGLKQWPEIDVLWVRSVLAPSRPGLERVLPTARVFPLARFLSGFDLAISASGYNTFHELLQAGVPAIFLPNSAPGMDNQSARATFAAALPCKATPLNRYPGLAP
jgi:UDP:flavonoid glycosyltransferase YjiC (YdhE family)